IIVIAASVFWSPYVAVGLATLALVLTLGLDRRETVLQRFRREGSAVHSPLPLVAFPFAIALVIVSSLFLLASKPLSYPQLIIQKDNMVGWLITYAANYAPYLFALTLTLWPLRNLATEHAHARFCCPEIPRILAGCLIASAVALLLGHGLYDDWGMRVSFPLS